MFQHKQWKQEAVSSPSRIQVNHTQWNEFLPFKWVKAVIIPQRFVRFDEYEISAHKIIGCDTYNAPCFYQHHYAEEEIRTDDDEEFYSEVIFSETVIAWRLRDSRWLVYTAYKKDGAEDATGFYAFSQEMPH